MHLSVSDFKILLHFILRKREKKEEKRSME